MPFYYPRQIRFHETDGAGVVYFANVLTLCHEAYEASLEAAGVELADFFSPRGIVMPVVHGSVDFFRPLGCGDRLTIALTPKPLPQADRPLSKFEIHYRLLDWAADPQDCPSDAAIQAEATTRHVCIDAATRRRQPLSEPLQGWLEWWR